MLHVLQVCKKSVTCVKKRSVIYICAKKSVACVKKSVTCVKKKVTCVQKVLLV